MKLTKVFLFVLQYLIKLTSHAFKYLSNLPYRNVEENSSLVQNVVSDIKGGEQVSLTTELLLRNDNEEISKTRKRPESSLRKKKYKSLLSLISCLGITDNESINTQNESNFQSRRISGLHTRIKKQFYPITEQIILLIGTNKCLRNEDFVTMCRDLSNLVKTLQGTTRLNVILTLPPVPRLENVDKIQHVEDKSGHLDTNKVSKVKESEHFLPLNIEVIQKKRKRSESKLGKRKQRSHLTLKSCQEVSEIVSVAQSEPNFQPQLLGYQMIGDSQFCRFGEQILGLRRESAPKFGSRIGICVSGQTISELHTRIKDQFYPISEKVILMIGTNDFLRNKDVTTMCQDLSDIVRTLQLTARQTVILTLPPIPRLENVDSTVHFNRLGLFNHHILSLQDGHTVQVADVSPEYIHSHPVRSRKSMFEKYFPGSKRVDLCHLNRKGLEVIRNHVLKYLK